MDESSQPDADKPIFGRRVQKTWPVGGASYKEFVPAPHDDPAFDSDVVAGMLPRRNSAYDHIFDVAAELLPKEHTRPTTQDGADGLPRIHIPSGSGYRFLLAIQLISTHGATRDQRYTAFCILKHTATYFGLTTREYA